MSILWGTSFPRFFLVKTITDETHTLTGNGTDRKFTVNLEHRSIIKEKDLLVISADYTYDNSDTTEHANPQYKGQSSFGIVNNIDYSAGTIDLNLSNVPDNGTDIIVSINYYYKVYDYSFTDIFLDDEDIMFKQVVNYDLTTFTNKIIRSREWRLVVNLNLTEYQAYTYTDQLRMIMSWNDKIVLFPRPDNLKGFFVYSPDDFAFSHPENKWIGQIFSIKFISEKTYNVIPNHNGQYDSATEDQNLGDVIL